jgi:Protein of unknown function (DUF2946)
MDEQVLRSLIKWPSVPECKGWLAFDRRGTWRMRNEYAQANHLAGEPIKHEGLIAFIERNLAHNEQGEWFFQNGPQRVYVDLAYTPFIARLHPDNGVYALRTTSGINFTPKECFMDENGQIVFLADFQIQYAPNAPETKNNLFEKTNKTVHILLHDHDLGIFSESAELQFACGELGHWNWQNQKIPVESARSADIKKNYFNLP